MRGGWLEAETLETLRVPQHRAPLRAQGGAGSGELWWPCPTHPQPLLGFLPRGNAAEGRQAQRHALRLLRLAPPMALGHAEQRCDRLGADWQADVSAPEWRGGLQLEGKRGANLLTQSARGPGGNQRLALGPGVVREPLHLEHLLALQQAVGIGAQPRDAGCARGELSQTGPQLGSSGALLGPPGWRECEPLLGPGDQAVPRQKPRCGPDCGRRQTRATRVRECARDPTTGRQKRGHCGVRLGGALEHARYGVSDLVEAWAGQSLLIEGGHGLGESAASVFEGGGRATHLGDEAVEPRGHRVARPGLRPRDAETVDPVQRAGARYELRGRGVYGQNGPHLARAQAHTASDQPDQAVAKGGLAQRPALKPAGRLGADPRQARHPLDDGVRTRCWLAPPRPSQETQDA